MPFGQTILDAIDRLKNKYNNGAYDPATNPGGFDQDGHPINFFPALTDTATVAEGAADKAEEVSADAETVAENLTASNTAKQGAEDARDKAQQWANADEDVEVEPGLFSAKHGAAKSAGQVVLATQQANRSRDEADRAAGFAAGLNVPAITPDDIGSFVRVGSNGEGGAAYELGLLTIATQQEVADGTGTGLVNAETFGAVFAGVQTTVNDISLTAGDVITSFGHHESDKWLLADGSIHLQAQHPDLYSLLGHKFLDYATLAKGRISAGDTSFSDASLVHLNGKWFLLQTKWTNTRYQRVRLSNDDGLTFQGKPSSWEADWNQVVFLNGDYVVIGGRGGYSGGSYGHLYSADDGETWIHQASPDLANANGAIWAASPTAIVGVAASRRWRMTNPRADMPNSQNIGANPVYSLVFGGGTFVLASNACKIYISSDDGDSFNSIYLRDRSSSLATDVTWVRAAYGNGRWVLFGTSGTARYFVSSDDLFNTLDVVVHASGSAAIFPSSVNFIKWNGFHFVYGIGSTFYISEDGLEFRKSRLSQADGFSGGLSYDTSGSGLIVAAPTGAITFGASVFGRANFAADIDTEFTLPSIDSEPATFVRGG